MNTTPISMARRILGAANCHIMRENERGGVVRSFWKIATPRRSDPQP